MMASTMMTLSALLLLLASSAVATQELAVAISEMQKANYFTFAMLLNMISPSDQRFRGNLTFLMPNNRVLSNTTVLQNEVAEFLLRHSIPSPMLFDYLNHIPSGSVIPTSKPDYVLVISNNGRRNFVLNNVKLISPNICTAGSVFRCHGIDGVLSLTVTHNNSALPSCVSTTTTSPPPLTSPTLSNNTRSIPVPQNAGHSTLSRAEFSNFLVSTVAVSLCVSSLYVIL